MDGYALPQEAVIEGKHYKINGDFRNILAIFSFLEDPDLPEFIRWQAALNRFYTEPLAEEHLSQGAEYFSWFVRMGQKESPPGPKLLDWQQDAPMIVADVNKVACQEIRQLPFVHWWTFLAWFHGIGEGQLSTVVALRQKRLEGKPLTEWEQDFYRRNKDLVDLPVKLSREEKQHKKWLMEQLRGEK